MFATHRRLLALAALACAPALSGCLGSSPAARFYLLEPLAAEGPAAPTVVGELAIGVGPVRLAEYLDRLQLVTRGRAREIRVEEYDRWAEPLRTSLARLLERNLSTLLGTERVWTYPPKDRGPVDLRVVVDVERFDADVDGAVTLRARWSVRDERRGATAALRTTTLREPAEDGGGTRDRVIAMNRAFDRLSGEIAEAVAAAAAAE